MSAGSSKEPNLTAFIDLFSVLICFLLMTAAWIQLESMSTSVEKSTASDAPDAAERPEKKVSLTVKMTGTSVVFKEDELETPIPYREGKIDRGTVEQLLAKWRDKYPDRKDVILNTETPVKYGDMIGMFDVLVGSNWTDVGINPQ